MADAEAYEFYADPANHRTTGRGHRRRADHLTQVKSIRFSVRMLARATAAADAEGMRLGSWIRRLVSFELIRLSREQRERPTGLIPGSARLGQPKALRSSLTPVRTGPVTTIAGNGLTFRCAHLSVANVDSASCGICGPLSAVA